MAELVILNVPQDVLSRMRYLANKGDEEAQGRALAGLHTSFRVLFMRWRGLPRERNPKLAWQQAAQRRETADDDRLNLRCLWSAANARAGDCWEL